MADDIGVRIARRRQALRMTQEELAAKLGVSRNTVASWESGKHFPKRKQGLVEEVLGISLAGEPEEPPLPETLLRVIAETLPDPEDQERVLDLIRRSRAGQLGDRSRRRASG